MHTDDDGWGAVVARITALHGSGKTHMGHLLQQDGAAFLPDHRHTLQIFHPVGAPNVANQEFTAVEVDESASGIGCKTAKCLLHLRERHPELGHACGIRLHPQLANLATYGNGLGHPWNRQQTRAQHKIRILAGLHGGCYGVFAIAFGQGQRNQHDLAHDRRHRPHDRGDPARELFAHQGQPLGDELTIAVNVGAPIEFGVQNGEAHAGCRAHPRHARHSVESGLQREGHQLFDFFGGHAARFCQHRDQWLVKVRKHIDRRAPCGDGPVDHQQRCDRQDKQAVVQAVTYDPVEHCVAPFSGSVRSAVRLAPPRGCQPPGPA